MTDLVSTDNYQTFFDELLSDLIELIPNAQTGSILLLEGNFLRFKTTKGYNLEKLKSMYLKPDSNLLISLANEVNLVNNIKEWDSKNFKKQQMELLTKHGGLETIKVLITFPLFTEEGKIYGEFNIENHDSEDAFTNEDVKLVEKFKCIAEIMINAKIKMFKLIESRVKLFNHLDMSFKLYDSYSHDIKNEIHAIMLMVSILENDVPTKFRNDVINKIEHVNKLSNEYQIMINKSMKESQKIMQKSDYLDFSFLEIAPPLNNFEAFDCGIEVTIRDKENKLLFEKKIPIKYEKENEIISIFKNFTLLSIENSKIGYHLDIMLKIYEDDYYKYSKAEQLIYPRQKQLFILYHIQNMLLDKHLKLLRRSKENYLNLVKFLEEKLVSTLDEIPDLTDYLSEEWSMNWATSKFKIKNYIKRVLECT